MRREPIAAIEAQGRMTARADMQSVRNSEDDALSSAPPKTNGRQSQTIGQSVDRRSADDNVARTGPSRTPPVVAAIFNTSPDLVDLLRRAFEPAGIVAVSVLTHQIREGVVDVEGFVRQHDPTVVVYDIAPPYDANWQLYQHISRMDVMQNRTVVLTSINARHVEKLAGRDQQIYEVVGKPYDLDQIVRAVREASRARPTR